MNNLSLSLAYAHFGLVMCGEFVIGTYRCTEPRGHSGPHTHLVNR